MAERVVLHIGTMKSGTTYLQDVLGSGALAGTDAWYVGGSFDVQNVAVRELLGRDRGPTPGWDRLVEEMAGRRGTAVVSHEFLSFMGQDRADEVVASLPVDEVSVVVTVRDQRRAIPAQWQSLTRNRGLDGWEEYQRRLEQPGRRDDPRARRAVRGFRRAQHVPGMLRRWGSLTGVRDTTLVVVPPADAGPAELWLRFCRAVGVDAGLPPAAARRSNESLGRASCETLVLFNRALESVPRERFAPWRDRALGALLPLRPQEDAPVLDQQGARLAQQLNRAIVDAAAEHSARVVGSLDELGRDDGTVHPPQTEPPPADQVVRAARAVRELLLGDPGAADLTATELVEDLAARLTAEGEGRPR